MALGSFSCVFYNKGHYEVVLNHQGMIIGSKPIEHKNFEIDHHQEPPGHSLKVLGYPQLKFSLTKMSSPNLTLLFDYNFLGLPVDEEFMVCPPTTL